MNRAMKSSNENRLQAAITTLLILLLGVSLAGCTTVRVRYPDGSLKSMSRESFAAYTEAVFRFHNRVVNDVIVASSLFGEQLLESDQTLLDAEAAMARTCQPLNNMVSATIEGRELGFFQKLQLLEAVPACEEASQAVDAILPAL